MLDEVIQGLGYSVIDEDETYQRSQEKEEPSTKGNKSNILERIEKGELTVSEALDLLKKKIRKGEYNVKRSIKRRTY